MDVVLHCEEQILNCNMPDTEDGEGYGNQDEEAVAMIEESPSGVGINLNKLGTSFLSGIIYLYLMLMTSFWFHMEN